MAAGAAQVAQEAIGPLDLQNRFQEVVLRVEADALQLLVSSVQLDGENRLKLRLRQRAEVVRILLQQFQELGPFPIDRRRGLPGLLPSPPPPWISSRGLVVGDDADDPTLNRIDLNPAFEHVAPDGGEVPIAGRGHDLPGEDGPQLDDIWISAVGQEGFELLSDGVTQRVLSHLGNIVDVDCSHPHVLIEVREVAVVVPVDEEAHILVTARRTHFAQVALGQLDQDRRFEQVLLWPQAHTGELFIAGVELNGLHYRKLDIR